MLNWNCPSTHWKLTPEVCPQPASVSKTQKFGPKNVSLSSVPVLKFSWAHSHSAPTSSMERLFGNDSGGTVKQLGTDSPLLLDDELPAEDELLELDPHAASASSIVANGPTNGMV